MAKTKKTLNTDLEDAAPRKRRAKKAIDESYTEPTETMGASDDVTYNMGDIQVNDSEDNDAEDFKKASQKMLVDSTDEDEEDWVDEELNVKDEDIFLDMDQDYDIDNPYRDDDF